MSNTSQKAEVAASAPAVNLWSLTVVCLFAWIIPGAGHFLVKRPKQGVIFLLLIVFLFFWGLNLGGKIYQYDASQPLTFFAMIAQAGMGLPYFIARLIASYAHAHTGWILGHFAENFRYGNGNIENVTFEYGNTFAIVAGLLNFLVVLDAHDIALGRRKG